MSRRPKPAPTHEAPSADALPDGIHHVSAPLARLALRLDELAASLGVSRRTIERERAAGRFPPPDLKIGKAPLWRPGTVQAWIEAQRASARKGGDR